ncbi:MAG: Helicase, SNF2/RAD54 family [Olavius algarvensis Gamma 1 endosymbiont]|nr:MAG: Helicase, SNF2/RAD54 family [Olavius algarvensis Gamma 1 endosymbiont]
MRILHAFWLPDATDAFFQDGSFQLWVELPEEGARKRGQGIPFHPFGLPGKAWPEFLGTLGIQPTGHQPGDLPELHTIHLPSAGGAPLPSPQLATYRPEVVTEGARTSLEPWRVHCRGLSQPIRQLSELHFLVRHRAEAIQLGDDFLFWYWFTQALKDFLLRDQYLPTLIYHQPPRLKGKRKSPPAELYGSFRWVSDQYGQLIRDARERMPAAGAAGLDGPGAGEGVLRHCAEVLLDRIVRVTQLPTTFLRKIDDSLLTACLDIRRQPWRITAKSQEDYRHWRQWRQRISGTEREAAFTLGFRLVEPSDEGEDDWALHFVAVPADDPSQRLAVADYWCASKAERTRMCRRLGKDFETHLLLDLGLAARMVPKLWAGLDTAEPQSVALDLDEAFDFLKESAWVLEDSGFKIIVPSWWTPQGRRRIKIRLQASPGSRAPSVTSMGGRHVALDNLMQYSYQLAIGDQAVSAEEWRQLVESKQPLVRFRGQWVELERDKMREMLAFWREHGKETSDLSIQEVLRRTATDDTFEIDRDDALGAMLDRLRDHNRLEPIADPPRLRAQLRDYQKRGVAWLRFLEQLGLNGCLADDMGLGKTMQVIACLVLEREDMADPAPTLLVAPTSVIGNWRKEIERFAPHLGTLVHHGPDRVQDPETFRRRAADQAMVITSYALARRDRKLLTAVDWRRVVLDEAQNIKNPLAAQTKAVLALQANHRLALTGTPVENRLTDLWSIFNFVNPGYLDTQTRFRKHFELPIQRDNDPARTATLKRLVEPFILRRVKTDRTIIADLPDKVEALQYCNLSREQAALYETVVRDVGQQLEEAEGIGRQGLMLSTLMRLKQICNHPAQFLQDGSAFTAERSHKLQRLREMLEEVMAKGDSVLIFSQFTEIGDRLDHFLKQELHRNTYYLHGGTPRGRREAMIEAFQDPRTEPTIFILSLKAGGVGITLTKANHVFHFDRWWNPAVEDQASDRAFRIGQEKNVFVHKFVTIGTLEERINAMIEEKKALAGAIVGNDESWLTQLDNERFKALIRLNKDAAVMD